MMELMPVTADHSSSAVENPEKAQGEESTKGATDGPRQEKKGLLRRVSQLKWKNIFTTVIVFLGHISVNTAYSTIEPFFPNEAAKQGASPFVTGVIISCAPLCVVILSPLIGYFLPQLTLRFTLLSGLWLVGGTYILLSFVASMPSGWVFIMFCILLRLTEGTGSAMYVTSVYTLLPQLFPDSTGTMIGLLDVGSGLGYALGPPIGGVLYTAGGFRLPFLVVGATSMAFLPLLFYLTPNFSCEKQVISLRTLVKLLTTFVMFLLVIGSTLLMAGLTFFTPIFQPFLTGQFHLSVEHIGVALLSAPAVYFVVALMMGKLSDEFGPRWFIIVGFLIESAAFFFIGPADFIAQPKLWITVIAYGFVGLGVAMGIVPIYVDMLTIAKSTANENSETVIGVVSGISVSAISLGEFIGPFIGGALIEVMDFQTSAMVFGEVLLAEGTLILGATLIDRWCGA